MFYKNNSKKIINTKFSLVVCLLFLLYFFSNNLIYATSITKTENDAQKTFTRIFAISAGIGLDAIACLKNVSSKIKFFFNKIHLGSLSYIANAVQYFTHLPEQTFSIQFEDTDSNSAESKNQISISKTILISLMNYKAEGGGLKMAPWAKYS